MTVDIDFKPDTKQQLQKCMKDKFWRLNNLYRVVNEAGKRVKFKLRPAQLKFLRDRHGLDGILKSRQHGFSTLIDIDILDDIIFISDLRCGIIAQTKEHAQAIFHDKIQYPYNQLIDEPFIGRLIPRTGRHGKNDAGELRLENNSSVKVGTSFRSATIHRLHISEYGKICAKYPDRALEIKTGTLPAVHPQEGGRITVESTAEGAAGDFYDLCQESRSDTAQSNILDRPLNPKQYKFHFYAWHEDAKNAIDPVGIQISPELNAYFADLYSKHQIALSPEQQAWYALTKDGSNGLKKKMKQEHPSTIDEAFEQAVEGAVYEEEMRDAYEEGRIRRINPVGNIPVYTFWDLGISKGNATCVIFAQFVHDQIHIIDYIEFENRAMVFMAKQVRNRDYLYSNETFCFMPHDVAKRDLGTGTPILDTAESCGLRCKPTIRPHNKDKDGIQAVRDIFNRIHIDNRCIVSDKDHGHYEGCDRLIKALGFYRYKWDEDFAQWSKAPIHDWASNPADCLQTLALAYRYEAIGGEYIGDLTPGQKYVMTENYEDDEYYDLLEL